jgi:hypothetical protein
MQVPISSFASYDNFFTFAMSLIFSNDDNEINEIESVNFLESVTEPILEFSTNTSSTKKTRSSAWEHFTLKEDKRAYCNYCK